MAVPTPRASAAARPPTELAARPGPRLLWEADALLAVIPQLRASGFVADLARLHRELSDMLRDFQMRARRDGIEPSRVAQATEVLAAVIDHVVTSMPWGVEAPWPSLGALSIAAGGRSAPQGSAARLLEVAHRSGADSGMRELIRIALALGFEGASAGTDEVQTNQLRAELAAHGPAAARVERELSPHWKPALDRASALSAWLPLWVSSAAAAAVLAGLFIALELSLAAKSDRLYARIAALNAPVAQAIHPLPAPQPRLAGILTAPLAAAGATVRDEIDRSVIVIPAAPLYRHGEAALLPGAVAFLRPLAAALALTPGRIEAIGHTAAGEVRAARYPSDWDLSVDRARAVAYALQELGVDGARLSYDGRADVEPAAEPEGPAAPAPGDAAGRIEIVLLAGR